MKKDFTRDYTVEMFRLWSALGCPRSSEILLRLTRYTPPLPPNDITGGEKYLNCDSDSVLCLSDTDKAEGCANREARDDEFAALLDALAAAKTVEELKKCGKEHIVSALSAVYLTSPRKKLPKGELSDRIRRFAAALPSDERSVYRWLREARWMCASLRGLRVC